MTAFALYKILHLLGIFSIFAVLGGVTLHAANGSTREENRLRRLVGIVHGFGSLLIVIAGFGMLAHYDLGSGAFPFGWVMVKVVLWLALSAAILIPYQQPRLARHLLLLLPVLGALAAALAIFKPF